MTEDAYDALDRATLATWRTGNMVWWSALALAAALVIHTVMDQIARGIGPILGGMNGRPTQDFPATWQFWAPKYGVRAGLAILAGFAIAAIVGLKTWRGQVALATTVAATYIVIVWLALEKSTPPYVIDEGTGVGRISSFPHHGWPVNALEWGYSALALMTLAIAPLGARFLAKRKAV